MSNRFLTHLTLTAALVAALGAAPAAAQQKGKSGDKGKQTETAKGQAKRPELQRRLREEQLRESEARRRDETRNGDYDRDDRDDRDDDYRYESNGRRKGVPPGWCIGKGNPHNTPENCGPNAGRSTYGRSGRSGSYEDAHAEFHRYLDRKYSDLADDRPLDPVHQIRIRRDRAAEHDRFHAEYGRRHD